jgi:hypothetical protein
MSFVNNLLLIGVQRLMRWVVSEIWGNKKNLTRMI